MKKKKQNYDSWPIPAGLFVGLGVGFLLTDKFPLAIPGCLMIGLGLGFLTAFIFSRRK